MLGLLVGALLCVQGANAHVAAWAKGMYCLNGPQTQQDLNSNEIVHPIFEQTFANMWMHHFDNCDLFPPPDGEFLELPAGKSFTVELAVNRAATTLSYGGKYTSEWPNGGGPYPEDWNLPTCITEPNLHTQNQSMAAGTAFAISYNSELKDVTPENLTVFTVRWHTPWKRVTSYDVPADLPSCPPNGCICAWGWVPNGCGEPNMYMEPFRCMVTGSTSTKVVGPAQPPVWCEDDQSKCVKGPKQMIYWNQLDGNNIVVSGWDLAGQNKSPAYNSKCGYADGAQNDIFTGGTSSTPSSSVPAVSPPSAASPSAAVLVSNDTSSGMPASDTPASNTPVANPPLSSMPASSMPPTPSGTPASSGNTGGHCNMARDLVKKSSIASHLKRHARQF